MAPRTAFKISDGATFSGTLPRVHRVRSHLYARSSIRLRVPVQSNAGVKWRTALLHDDAGNNLHKKPPRYSFRAAAVKSFLLLPWDVLERLVQLCKLLQTRTHKRELLSL